MRGLRLAPEPAPAPEDDQRTGPGTNQGTEQGPPAGADQQAAPGTAPATVARPGLPAMPPPPAPLPTAALPARPAIGGTVRIGLVILGLFFGGLLAWSLLAPLSSAAVAPGVIIVDSNRKTIQHLEGGIIGEILVEDGAEVEAGQVLLRLDDAQARAMWNQVRGQQDALEAQAARLIAERDGAEVITFSAELEARRSDPQMAEILTGQETIFAQRRQSLEDQIGLLRQRIAQLNKEIESRQAQISSANRQAELIGEEIKGVEELVAKGLERRSRLLALQRQAAGLEGQRGEQQGLAARAEQRIGETELQIISQRNSHINEVVAELREAQTRLSEVAERAAAAKDVLARRDIVSPIQGTVVDLKFFTAGGVIASGVPILDIVPRNDRLVVEARVQPIDIDVVQTGLKAQVTLSAFKQRTTPTLEGRVVYVSADSLTDPRTGFPYFGARVEISAAEMQRLGGLELSPGMPAQVMIVTGERTAFQYLTDPLRESLQRAFREQ